MVRNDCAEGHRSAYASVMMMLLMIYCNRLHTGSHLGFIEHHFEDCAHCEGRV